jgi:NTP pyrophosphatase (non-canonical NTP hydrolase)
MNQFIKLSDDTELNIDIKAVVRKDYENMDNLGIQELAKDIHENALKKGFWEDANIGEKLMLIVSELSEALEADRKNRYFKKEIGAVNGWVYDKDFEEHFTTDVKDTFQDELADVFIRLLDLSTYLGIDLLGHVIAKNRYNKSRPYKHGKKY